MAQSVAFGNDDPLISEDLSGGKEKFKVRVLSEYRNVGQPPDPFTYITELEMDPPNLIEPEDPPSTKKAKFEEISADLRPTARLQVFYTGSKQKEWGLQALEDIGPGKLLFEYTGVLSKPEDEDEEVENDDYIVGIEHNGQTYFLDAHEKGNLARFVNHSCQPNCCALIGFPKEDGVPRVLIYSLRQIFACEELLMDYGKRWWEAKSEYFSCGCLMKKCHYKQKWCDEVQEKRMTTTNRSRMVARKCTGGRAPRKQMAMKVARKWAPAHARAPVYGIPAVAQIAHHDLEYLNGVLEQGMSSDDDDEEGEDEEEEEEEEDEEEEDEEEEKEKEVRD